MPYVDGFLLPIAKKNLRAYAAIAKKAGAIWKEHGAVDYVECVGDDLASKWGISFPKVAKAKRGETVLFSYIVHRSRAHRDRVNKKVMKDRRIREMTDPEGMPFDMKRMAYGGFRVLVHVPGGRAHA